MSDKKPWTVMIYLAGDNNLSDEMIWALKEMYRVGTGGKCNVVVQFDPSALYAEPRRYDIGKIEGSAAGAADVDGIIELDSLKETLIPSSSAIQNLENSADRGVLGDFLKWTLSQPRLEAQHYMLVLSGHGNGATGGFLQDLNPRSELSIPDLGDVLRGACKMLPDDKVVKKIDILGLDSCVMSMAEVGHQVQEAVEFLVGAEGFEQNAGWPYHRLLEVFGTFSDPPKVSEAMVERYFLYYSDYLAAGVSIDQSVVRVEGAWQSKLIQPFTTLTKHLIGAFKAKNAAVKNAVVLAHWAAQSYNYEQHVDLYDFCKQLDQYLELGQQGSIVAELRSACSNIASNIAGKDSSKEPWKDHLVPYSLYSGPAYQHSHGLSIYFPWFEMSLDYDKLDFSRDTGWGTFLRLYIDETCREIRDREYHEKKGHKLQQMEAICDGGFVGPCGWPVYQAGGPIEARGGGPNSGRGGGPNSARLSEIAGLQSMKNFPTRFFQPDKISEQSLLSLNQVRNSLDKDKVEQTLNSLDPKVAASTLESASSNWVSELLNAADKNGIEKVLKGLTAETRERIDDCLK